MATLACCLYCLGLSRARVVYYMIGLYTIQFGQTVERAKLLTTDHRYIPCILAKGECWEIVMINMTWWLLMLDVYREEVVAYYYYYYYLTSSTSLWLLLKVQWVFSLTKFLYIQYRGSVAVAIYIGIAIADTHILVLLLLPRIYWYCYCWHAYIGIARYWCDNIYCHNWGSIEAHCLIYKF